MLRNMETDGDNCNVLKSGTIWIAFRRYKMLTATSWVTTNLLKWITAPSNWLKWNEGKQGRGWRERLHAAFTHGWIWVWGRLHTTKENVWRGIRSGGSRSAHSQWNNHSWENNLRGKYSPRILWGRLDLHNWVDTERRPPLHESEEQQGSSLSQDVWLHVY